MQRFEISQSGTIRHVKVSKLFHARSLGRITNLNRDGAFSELENVHHYPIDSIVEIEFPATGNKKSSQLQVSAIVVHHESGNGLGLMFLDENKKYQRWWQSTLKNKEAHSALPSCKLL